MLRTIIALLCVFAAAPSLAAAPAVAKPQVAIIHFNDLKAAKLDGTAKNLRLMPMLGAPGETPYIRLMNELTVPREVVVRVLDLQEPEYDVYLDGRFLGTKRKDELESGVRVSFSGTLIPPNYWAYYSRLKTRALAASARYEGVQDKDADVCRAVFRGVASWVSKLRKGDERKRTVSLIVAPADRPLSLPGAAMEGVTDFSESVPKLGDAVQLARQDLNRLVKNDIYKYDALAVITPIDFDLKVPSTFPAGKKILVRALLTNGTDRAIKGKVKLNVPSGWKVTPASAAVSMPGYDRRAEAKFYVTAPKSSKQNGPIAADADLSVGIVTVKLQAKGSAK